MPATLAIEGGRPVREGVPVSFYPTSYGYEELKAVIDVFESKVLCRIHPGARQAEEFEREFADWAGLKHAVAYSSGTTAQHGSLAAIGVGPGDEVIVPPLTFISTAYTVLLQCAVPVFADVDPGTFNIDPAEIRNKVTKRTKAIVSVHWFGHPAEMNQIMEIAREYDLRVIEDCAHAFGMEYKGKRAGTMGDMACWSLHASKMITALGEGGVLSTNDDELAERARMMMDHGKKRLPREQRYVGHLGSYQVVTLGNHYRMTEAQAAFARVQLRRFPELYARRKECGEYLYFHLGDLDGVIQQETRPDVKRSYSYLVVRFDSEKFRKTLPEIARAIEAEGVQIHIGFAKDELSHVHPIFTDLAGREGAGCPWKCPYYDGDVEYGWGTLSIAEKVGPELLALPLHPGLSDKDLEDEVAAVRKVAEAYHV